MEDEGGVKAPVTRLRRRVSIEQSDEVKSSPASNTPTKKRGSRRAAKPELDLIDENASENITPKRATKKLATKELDVIEEKPGTPSRRSARIKSNSSIVLETTQALDSPRAKRAARRTSQVGSDNEAPLTPARQTRRNRKDSGNAEKAEPEVANKPFIKEMIAEEPESSLRKSCGSPSITTEKTQSPSGLRQSPRLNLKNNVSAGTEEPQYKETSGGEDNNTSNKENVTILAEESEKNELSQAKEKVYIIDLLNSNKNKLSESSSEILNQLKMEPRKTRNILNKSSSAVVDTGSLKNKRQRAKSWTTLTEPVLEDSKYNSDSEIAKEKHFSQTSNTNKLNLSSNKRRRSTPVDSKVEVQSDIRDSLKKNNNGKSPSSLNPTEKALENIFDKEPADLLRITVYESDLNSDPLNVNQKVHDDDQCVPVVKSYSNRKNTQHKGNKSFNYNTENSQNIFVNKIENKIDSCEPMDIDETIPDNMELNKSLQTTSNTSENKVSDAKDDLIENIVNEGDKKQRSSLSLSTTQTPEKTANDNKSTFVSQLKDTLNKHVVALSPQIPAEKMISKSNHTLNVTKDIEIDKQNRSLNYLTSTPLQQKNLAKLNAQVNTSSINSNNTSNIDKSSNDPKTNKSTLSNTSNKSGENPTSDGGDDDNNDESSMEENIFVDDEAEEASDDYESGDSKDEEQERYELENEIVHKGETLTSEDELSNDTDYEKDSFVVSSDAEDNALLDGSGNDLSMTDDELKMTAKSKQKYNERKIKEQKRVSREMFESRHKLNMSDKSSKSNKSKIKKNRTVLVSTDSDDDDSQMIVKKSNRMRLDSSHDVSINKSMDNDPNIQSNKILSKSASNDSTVNEVEMTICEENAKEEIDPLSIEIKKESKTPQKERTNQAIEYIDPKHTTENEGDSNESQTKDKYFHNPLEESNTSDSSDSCENVHIQNYDSVLNDLNNSMKNKNSKECDISLNLDKKNKQKSSAPIIDQLNLTQVKTNKLKRKQLKDSTNLMANYKSFDKKSEKFDSNMQPGNDNIESDNKSSDSIDLKLLFSEESNSSDIRQSKTKNDDLEMNDKDSYIPLKNSQGKTNILETSGINDIQVSESSKKKNKKRQSIDKSVAEDETCDTTGTHNSTAVKKSFSVSDTYKEIEKSDDVNEAPVEIFNKITLKKQSNIIHVEEEIIKPDSPVKDKTPSKTNKSDMSTKQLSKSLTKSKADTNESNADKSNIKQDDMPDNNEETLHQSGDQDSIVVSKIVIKTNATEKLEEHDNVNEKRQETDEKDKSLNKSVTKTEKSEKKKKKKLSLSQSLEEICDQDNNTVSKTGINTSATPTLDVQKNTHEKENEKEVEDMSINKSMAKTPKSEKKRKRKLSQSQSSEDISNQVITEKDHNISLNSSMKHTPETTENMTEDVGDKTINESMSKTPKSEKKRKKKLSQSQSAKDILNEVTTEIDHNNSLKTAGKHSSEITEDLVKDGATNSSLVKTPISEKKKSQKTVTNAMENIDKSLTELNNSLANTKKNKQKLSIDTINNPTKENVGMTQEKVNSKKRKRNSSLNQTDIEQGEAVDTTSTSKNSILHKDISTNNKEMKKRKISYNIEDPESHTKIGPQAGDNDLNQKIKGKKLRRPLENRDTLQNTTDITDITMSKKKGTKKRKEREDDERNSIAKVPKIDAFNKVQVPRLPTSVLNKLEDKPKKTQPKFTKPKAISTTDFDVEESKILKTKPSRYLEESIYIDENETSDTKKHENFRNSKVLPFLPTVSTSNSGYTTNFKVNIIPKEVKFVAKSNVSNYKNDYLENKKMKRLGTYELYKRNRNMKMSKF